MVERGGGEGTPLKEAMVEGNGRKRWRWWGNGRRGGGGGTRVKVAGHVDVSVHDGTIAQAHIHCQSIATNYDGGSEYDVRVLRVTLPTIFYPPGRPTGVTLLPLLIFE